MNVRYTIEELTDVAVSEIGFCVGVHWRSVTGSCVPEGMVSARCRLAYVLFTGFAAAYRFHNLLARERGDRLPRRNIRLVRVDHAGQSMVGVAVIAVVSPDSDQAAGLRRAPTPHRQPGYRRYFQKQAARAESGPSWWDEPEHDAGLNVERFSDEPEHQGFGDTDELGLELLLDQIEAEYDEKLWWYGAPGRRTKYAPALGSVRELFAYARKQELPPEEIARRNRERQSEQWVSEQRARDRQRQRELDADQIEVAAALHTPRRGHKHTDDEDWLATEGALKARKGLKHLYRDAAPRPRRPRSA